MRFFRVVLGLRGTKIVFNLGQKFFFSTSYMIPLYLLSLRLSRIEFSLVSSHGIVHVPLIKGELTTDVQIFDPVKFVKFLYQ